MDAMTAAYAARMVGDTELTTTQGVITTQGRLKQDPKLLQKPRHVFRIMGMSSVNGEHGGGYDVHIESKVWGYDGNPGAREPACLAAAERISELMLMKFDGVSELVGGGTTRPGESPGWQQVDDTDPLTVHLHNGFTVRYWSAQRVAVLAS